MWATGKAHASKGTTMMWVDPGRNNAWCGARGCNHWEYFEDVFKRRVKKMIWGALLFVVGVAVVAWLVVGWMVLSVELQCRHHSGMVGRSARVRKNGIECRDL
jgi:hypothetical protein